MGNQVQCPNCGGYKVGYQYEGDRGCASFVLLFGVPLVLMGGLAFGLGHHLEGLAAALGAIVIGALLISVIAAAVWLDQPKQTHLRKCILCGYEWDTRSSPQVTVRPDLILKGEEKLRAEQEEERKRQEAMWWQQQQKK